ncbi:siderophore synthetase component [Chitinophaga dinghuensis]|uniref:Siderophore synthetase component n=1 Tax=Chitinophaga dinghuensis TaxID=1539050 RepID=A0A327VV21_9BACT|nr:IucA/IucC family siderophore biosynthesis protein [Chitinophaga dinghuensis]RAJ79103.1 siderophore synthetase component [Chitinophaga dinghuensis]
MNTSKSTMNTPQQLTAHLQSDIWARVNRLHLAKVISEFSHELLLSPEQISNEGNWSAYRLPSPENPAIVYYFNARILQLQHWSLDTASIRKMQDGKEMPLDSILFFQEFQSLLNISTEHLPAYLEEVTNTLYGSAYTMFRPQPSMEDLAQADYQTIEHAMTAGHPCFVANNGRIGFDANDYPQYAPEADQPVHLIWLAGHKSRTAYNAVEELPYNKLMEQELGTATLQDFRQQLQEKGLTPEEYIFIPVHPWQWYNKLAMICAPDLANQHLVCLGYGPDHFSVQQSIRTFYNLSHPDKHYTKTALSILNMGFVRGLTPYYMDSTPAITSWIRKAVGEDPYMVKNGFTLLCEVATVGYRNFYYEPFGKQVAYNKMLAGLWRESPAKVLQPGQRLMTMAALLHIDYQGNALLPALIKLSGLSIREWLTSYLRAYLTPLLHCFYVHDLVFMPHGENLILVLENHVPVKAIMKDITEEIGVFRMNMDIPEKGRRICVTVPEDLKILSILTDVFDCFFRFLSNILVMHCNYEEQDFWQDVAACIHAYQDEHPELSEKFRQYDIFMPEFILSCLNRLQLRNHRQMVDLADPAGSLQLAGMLRNPVAGFRRTASLANTLATNEVSS